MLSSPARAREGGGAVVGDLGHRLAVLGDPLLARAVDQLHPVVAVVEEVPVGVGGEPVVAIAIEDDGVVVGDPAAAHQLAEGLGVEEVALDLVLEVELPVEADRAGDVRLGVQRRVLVHLDDPDRVVIEVLGDPIGLHQHVVCVAHPEPPRSRVIADYRILSEPSPLESRALRRIPGWGLDDRRPTSYPVSPIAAAAISPAQPRGSAGSAVTISTGIRHVRDAARTISARPPAPPARPSRPPRRGSRGPACRRGARAGPPDAGRGSRQPPRPRPTAEPSSQATTATSPTRSRTVPGRSGSASAGSIPAAAISASPDSVREVPRTAQPRSTI